MSRTPGLCSTMINTYQTSLAPPPVPPRLNRSHPVLIPAPVTSPNYSKSLIRFMVGVVMLHLVLSVTGFIFLYNNGRKLGNYQVDGYEDTSETDTYFSPEKLKTSNRILARMVVQTPPPAPKSEPGYLPWDMKSSRYSHGVINYYEKSWLIIMESGDYHVYSKVTFSRSNKTTPLVNRIKLKKSKTDPKEKTIMQAFCHLEMSGGPSMCTAMQGDVITLTKGNLLSVWVADLSLVDYEEGATTFGLYKL